MKKIIISLLIILTMSLFTTSLAGQYADIDFIDFKNMVYNVYTNWGTQFTDYKDLVSSTLDLHKEEIEPYLYLFNNNKAVFYQLNKQYTNNYLCLSYLTNNNQNLYINQNSIYTGSTRSVVFSFSSFTSGNPVFNITTYNSPNYGLTILLNNHQYFANSNVYSNANLTSVSIAQGLNYDFLTGSFTRDQFIFEYNENLDIVNIQGFGLCPKMVFNTGSCFLGKQKNYHNLKAIGLTRYYYSNGSWVVLDNGMYDILLSKRVSGDTMDLYYESSQYNIQGTISRVRLFPVSGDYMIIDSYFYLPTRNDIIVNGTLDPNATFSGDNNPTYDDDIQHQQNINEIKDINDTITDDSQVDNIIDDYFGNSGDNFLNEIGYNPLENPFTTIILNTMESFTNVLLGSGNQTLNFPFGTTTVTLHSEDFVLPNGWLKNLISIICNGLLFWAIVKYGFGLYQYINSGRLQNLVNETNNHQYYLF